MKCRALARRPPLRWFLPVVASWLLLAELAPLFGQSFRITDFQTDAAGRITVQHSTDTNSYYVLYRGGEVTNIRQPAGMALALAANGQLTDSSPGLTGEARFYVVRQVPLSAPLDSDNDGMDDVFELRRGGFLNPLNSSDAQVDFDRDGRSNLHEYQSGTDPAVALPPLTLISSSPANGERAVAVTRETVLQFSNPLTNTTVITTNLLSATFGGRRILSRAELSSDRRKVTLFYLENLPGSSRIQVSFNGNTVLDERGLAVDADGDGAPGGTGTILFDTQTLTKFADTIVAGRVFASELAVRTNGLTNLSVNVPLAGVIVTADGLEETVRAVTDALGNFRLTNCPAGQFFVHIDGRTVRDDPKRIRYPDLAYYPFVGKLWESVLGEEINIGEIYLPLISANSLKTASMINDTVVTFPTNVLAQFPQLNGVSLTVPANSLFSDSGIRGGMVGIAPVPADRLPGPLQLGLEFPIVITVQTDGGSNFDRPVSACFPNLPDPKTGKLLGPGEQSALWSFNHDTGRFEIVGSMTVSADGKTICTDPGVGIPAPGWHGAAPGSVGTGGTLVSGEGGAGTGSGTEAQQEPGTKPGSRCPASPSFFSSCNLDQIMSSILGAVGLKADPIYFFSGEFYESVEDLRIKGRGLDFVWSRKYRSKLRPKTAQGNGWDFSYNVSITADGNDLLLNDGNSRADRYQKQASGVWGKRDFFRELSLNADGTYTMQFEDQGRWVFNALNGTPAAGKLVRIIDRHGNTLTLSYDAQGRLNRVRDTLDRDIAIAYTAAGFIASVTDFAGRVVRYDYYTDADAGGSRGDLKSVTSPAVTGTPNVNDFPNGKTTTYAYTKGFANEQLNHNLLTITDGRRNDPNDPTFGQGPYLINTYASTQDTNDFNFGRVVRQVWGGDIIDLTYISVLPFGGSGGAVTKTILNDRNGNVSEMFFDTRHRLVLLREFTGRADPRQPTTETSNRPKNPLRSTDPAFFETSYSWNDDSLPTQVRHPNGNLTQLVYESDLNPNAPPRTRANLRTIRKLPGTHQPAGDQTVIEEHYDYAADFGCGSCGFNFVTRELDGRGNETRHTYDGKGNRIRTQHRIASNVEDFEYNQFGQLTAHVQPDNGNNHRRRDEMTYYETGSQRGYARQRIIDATALKLTITYEYDSVGNVIRVIDPRGHDTRISVNQLDQVVRTTSREVAEGSGVRYQQDLTYDANNNVRQIDILNLDELGRSQLNAHFTLTAEYEILNHLMRITEEVDPARVLTSEFQYDANRNQVLVRLGEAVNGQQPANTIRFLYDERDLPFRQIRSEGHADQSSVQLDYDANRNFVRLTTGLESNPRVYTFTYDGYDRKIAGRDPMGNVQRHGYDANDSLVRIEHWGELTDQSGDSANVRLMDVAFTYDAMDRQVRVSRAYFATASQQPIGDGDSAQQTFYTASSQVERTVDDNGRQMIFAYDTAHRLVRATDHKGNTTSYDYDPNGNKVRVTQIEKPELSGPDESFVTTVDYDSLDRSFRVRDSAGNVRQTAYDSRNNPVLERDALGNTVRHSYDGLSRLLQSRVDLTDTGTGAGTPVSQILLSQTWDDSSRLVTRRDSNGNVIRFFYDSLNRMIGRAFADGTAQTNRLDVHDNLVRFVDANGSVVNFAYDLLNRPVRKDITAGPSVATDTTFETYGYDGFSRMVRAEDNDSVVTLSYNSLSLVTRETLNGDATESVYDGVGNLLACTYPGGRRVATTYDELNRAKSVADPSGVIATFDYTGPDRLARRDYGNGTRLALSYDGLMGVANPTGDAGVRQIVRSTHTRTSGASIIDDRSYRWDPSFNKVQRRDLVSGLEHNYAYDSAYRLIRSRQAVPGAGESTINYTLDAANNRLAVSGGVRSGPYSLGSALPEPADLQANQYTGTPFDQRLYDRNGNLSSLNRSAPRERRAAYDYRNQMVSFSGTDSGIAATYAYDALGRRFRKAVTGPNAETTRYLYHQARVVEERTETGATQATYVYGLYIDDVLQMQRGGQVFYFHCDDQFNVMKVTDAAGNLVEHYDYGDFGEPLIRDSSGNTRDRSVIGNPYLFTGRNYDPESGFYYFRTRYLDPLSGRFVSRDLIGIWGDGVNLGNGFAYVGNNPWTFVDPMGLDIMPRVTGVLWVIFGGVEAGTGYGIATTTGVTGIGLVAGVGIGAHGTDVMWQGARQIWYGKYQHTYTSDAVTAVTGKRHYGELADAAISIGPMAATAVAKCVPRTVNWIFRAERAGEGANAAQKIYSATENLDAIYESGRVWGRTEGSVYGIAVENASRMRTMANTKNVEAGTLVFADEAAALFQPHAYEGYYSGLKRLLGQQKAGFGDIVFNKATAVFIRPNVLLIRNGRIGAHAMANQSTLWAASRLWGRRALDLGLTGGMTASRVDLGLLP